MVTLDDFQIGIASFNECTLQIIGHTDQDGSIDYNVELSKNRAEEVKQYFINNGISESKIYISFLGESDLIHNTLDEKSKQQNRRVTIVAEGYTYQNVGELVTQLKPEVKDVFTVDQFSESNLNLAQGTEVTIPPNAFCHLDGTPVESSEVDLTFKEAFEYIDMIDERLYTQTEDKLLETGGMIYIEASQNGKPLRLQAGKSIELLFPAQDQKDGMELFTGSEDENGIIWEETGEGITSVTSPTEKVETEPIKVDLSPLLDFELVEKDNPNLSFGEMIPYPRPARIAYAPFKGNYTEEGYEKAVRKYNVVMEAHEIDQVDRPERLAHWENEVSLRKIALYQHKENVARAKLIDQLKENLVRLKDKKDEVCHERLVSVLFKFLDNEVGRMEYDERYYKLETFGKGLGDVIKYDGLTMPNFEQKEGYWLFKEFYKSLLEVEGRIQKVKVERKNKILDQQIEAGIINNSTVSRYLVKTSNLGWINCDRFYQISEDEKMDLQFASGSYDDRYFLVFKNIRSLIRPSKIDGNIVFKGIPKGEEVRLVAMKVKDGSASLAKQDFTLGSNVDVDLTFASAEMKELRKALNDI